MTGTQALLGAGIASLPVRMSEVADKFSIKVVDFTSFTKSYKCSMEDVYRKMSYAGFSLMLDGTMVCVLNSGLCNQQRRKWTSAHEIGHLLSGHISDEASLLTAEQEREADRFAAELLAPLTVLHFCGVSSALEIERLCGLSRRASEIRFAELTRLRRTQDDIFRLGSRSDSFTPECVFLRTDDERELFARFSPFIGSYLLSRAENDGYEQFLIRRARQPMAI